MAFGPRCNPGTPSGIGLPNVALVQRGSQAQPSNLGLGHVPDLPIPAPLRCGEGKGHPNSVVEQGCTRSKSTTVPAHQIHIITSSSTARKPSQLKKEIVPRGALLRTATHYRGHITFDRRRISCVGTDHSTVVASTLIPCSWPIRCSTCDLFTLVSIIRSILGWTFFRTL